LCGIRLPASIRVGEIHHERENVPGVKTSIHAHELAKTLERQPGRNQQQERQRDFRHHQPRADAVATKCVRRAPAFFQGFIQAPCARTLKRGQKPKEHAGQD
jgi:hypothetical protein